MGGSVWWSNNRAIKLQKSTLVNVNQSQSKLVKLGQSWSSEVQSHMGRPKGMEKGNTKSNYSYKIKLSVFEAKMSEMTDAKQS